MNNIPSTPIHVLDKKDEANQLVPAPDSITNFADDPEAKDYVMREIWQLISYARSADMPIREEWKDILRMTTLEHDSNQTYKGMSNGYLPLYARAHQTRVNHISRALFPTDEYVDVRPLDPDQNEDQVEAVKNWMQYQFEKQMKVRTTIKPFLRQLYNYGISVGKIGYDKAIKKKARTTKLPAIGDLVMDYSAYDRRKEGCRFKTRSMFSWHMWPPTVDDIKEATLVFEDIQMSKQAIMEYGKLQGWKNLDQAIWGNPMDNINGDMQEIQNSIKLDPSIAADTRAMGDKAHWAFLTEAYFTMPVPTSLYRENETPGDHVPVQVILAGSIPILIRRNPFWFQHAPYVVSRTNDTPDSFYGTGMGRQAKSLQALANDFMNQTNDNASYGLNPMVFANPNMLVGPLEPMEPGRTWYMTDVGTGVKFDRPPIEQMQYGMQLVNMLSSQLNDLLGTPPVMQGNNTGGAAKTATGSQILQQNVTTDLKDEVEDIELDVLIPLMEMAHCLGQQYQDQDLQLATAGGLIIVKPEDLVGQFGFQWLASSQSMNQQQRAQQAMQLLQMMQPMVPMFMQLGYKYDPTKLITRIAKEGMGFRDFDSVLSQMGPDQMGAQVQGGMPIAGAPGQAPPPKPGGSPPAGPPGQNPAAGVRSTVAQATPQHPMAPGEGEAFNQVRQQSDQMSAAAGAQGGGIGPR
jgi:hypothetical protein